jgi:phosphatidate cytidylyltransferase
VLAKRIVTALILIPIVAWAVLLSPLWLLSGLVGVIALLALWEFFRLGDQIGLTGFVQWTTLCSLLIVYMQWRTSAMSAEPFAGASVGPFVSREMGGIESVLIVFVVGLAFCASLTKLDLRRRMGALAISAGGLLLVVFPLSYVLRIGCFPEGRRLLMLVLVMIWAGDTAAYLAGSTFAKIPMAPVLSPKKTWEGAAANLLGSMVVGALGARWMPVPLGAILVLAVLTNVAGQAGDLLESAYKRSAGVKDSGVLLPGHGGMLDRIDSLIIAAPMAWWYLWLLARLGHLR